MNHIAENRKQTGADRRLTAVTGGAPDKRLSFTPFRGMDNRDSGRSLGIVTKTSSTPATPSFQATSKDGEVINFIQKKDLSLTLVKTPDQTRATRWALKSVSNKLLPQSRTAKCMRFLAPVTGKLLIKGNDHIQIHKSVEHNKAFYTGLMTCGSIWNCPICASKVSERRRQELRTAIESAKLLGWGIHFVTLTVPHGIGDDLAVIKKLQQKALTKLSSGRGSIKNQLQANGIEQHGYIRAYEVTHGKNGFHPHFHIILFTSPNVTHKTIEKYYSQAWQKACVSVGLPKPSDKHGCTVQDGSKAADYASKWGIEDEMTKANTKVTKRSGKTPFGLLKAILDDDDPEYSPEYASKLFRVYSKCMSGARQLYWSNGLRSKLALANEETDQQLAENISDDNSVYLASISFQQWKAVRKAKAEAHLLTAAESIPEGLVHKILPEIIDGYLKRSELKNCEIKTAKQAGRGPLQG